MDRKVEIYKAEAIFIKCKVTIWIAAVSDETSSEEIFSAANLIILGCRAFSEKKKRGGLELEIKKKAVACFLSSAWCPPTNACRLMGSSQAGSP